MRAALRPPAPDAWEDACGAGTPTLFHRGDTHPGDGSPAGTGTNRRRPGQARLPHTSGPRIAHDVYEAETTGDPDRVRGGDGGEAVGGGGYGRVRPVIGPYRPSHRRRRRAPESSEGRHPDQG